MQFKNMTLAMGVILSLAYASPVFCAEKTTSDTSSSEVVEKTAKAPDEKEAKADKKKEPGAASTAAQKTEKELPRSPASSQELLSTETVEYLKDAGKKVEKYFDPISKQ